MELSKLRERFDPTLISWRVGQAGKKQNGQVWAKILAYVDNRLIQDRLDEVCGPENWCNQYKEGPGGGVICGISIYVPGHPNTVSASIGSTYGEWVTKWDGADNTDIESVKGGLSDSMKRAAVQWGIARYLYDLGETFADIGEGQPYYANCKVKVRGGGDEWVDFKWGVPQQVLKHLGAPVKFADKPMQLNTSAAQPSLDFIAKAIESATAYEGLVQPYKDLANMRLSKERNDALVACLKRRSDLAVGEEQKREVMKDLKLHTPDVVAEVKAYWNSKRK
jgi:hypothetical protein